MKRVLLIIMCFLFCIVVNAKVSYSQAQIKANNYIKGFSDYQKYFVTRNTKYGFNSSNSIVNNNNFKTGGLINEQEFKVASGSINSSYLFNGLTYFTMTENDYRVKIIDPTSPSGINESNLSNVISNVRVTNYIESEIVVEGQGTRVHPWKITPRYNVIFDYDDTKLKLSQSSTTVTKGGYVNVGVTSLGNYTYVSETNCGTITNGVLTVSGITSDTVCRIEATYKKYKVTIDANGGTFKSNMNSELGWTLTDGNTKANKEITYSTPIGNLPNDTHMTKVGYSFDGIFNGATVINSSTAVTSDMTLTVHWKGNKYKVTYNTNGGSISPEYIELTYDEPYSGLHTPTKNGCTFKGWYKDSSLTNKIEEGTTILNTPSDHTIYAKWDSKTYTVTYNSNGGSGTMENSTATYDVNFVTRQNTFTRSGYTFNGWNEKADGTGTVWALTSNGVYENGNGTHPWKWTYTNNITLYAQWTPKTYTVTYNANGGSGSMTNSTATYDANFVTRQNTFTKTGYTFNGWNEKADGTGTAWGLSANGVYENGNGTKPWKWTYTNNITLYAQWTLRTYTVTYDYNLFTATTHTDTNSNNLTITYDENNNYITLNGTAQYSFDFGKLMNPTISVGEQYRMTVEYISGTYTSSGPTIAVFDILKDSNFYTGRTPGTHYVDVGQLPLSGSISNTITITSAVMDCNAFYYRVWQDGNHNETFSNYKIRISATKVDSKNVNYGSTYGTLPTPVKNGYSFAGWYTALNGGTNITSSSTYTTVGNQTLYAHWTPKTYTVTYNANGGSGSMSNTTATYNANFVTRQNTFTKEGYTFNGWNEKADGTGTAWGLSANGVYENGNGTKPWKWTYTKNITLYAQWAPYRINVTFNCVNGSGTTTNTYIYGSSTALNSSGNTIEKKFVHSCTRSGYTGSRWKAPNGTNDWAWTLDVNDTWISNVYNNTYGNSNHNITLTPTWLETSKTVACSSSNWSTKESSNNCPTGYTYSSNNCSRTASSYTYSGNITCSRTKYSCTWLEWSNATLSGTDCRYYSHKTCRKNATVDSYSYSGTCQCSNGSSKTCNASVYSMQCNVACQSTGNGTSVGGSCTRTTNYKCDEGANVGSGKCQYSAGYVADCKSGWTVYSQTCNSSSATLNNTTGTCHYAAQASTTTSTVACSSSNWSTRTSDSSCTSGYTYSSNNCSRSVSAYSYSGNITCTLSN